MTLRPASNFSLSSRSTRWLSATESRSAATRALALARLAAAVRTSR